MCFPWSNTNGDQVLIMLSCLFLLQVFRQVSYPLGSSKLMTENVFVNYFRFNSHTYLIFFSGLYFHHCILSSVPNCSDLSHLHLLISNSDLSYSCIHSSNLKTGWTFDQIFHEVLSQWLTGLYISQNFDTLSFFVNSSYY